MPGAGECYLIKTRINHHLHIVLLDYEDFSGTTVIVNIETLDSPRQEQTTVLEAGCHPFVTHKSYVNYRRAQTYSRASLDQLVRNGDAVPKEPMPHEVLKRIQDGLLRSTRTPPITKHYYENKYWDQLSGKTK